MRKKRKEPKYDVLRGRHRKNASNETQHWNEEHLVPEQPSWMDKDTYCKLAKLRGDL